MTREDAIQFLTDTDISPEHIMELVEALSRSENPNKWIPISERLPEEGEEVLVSGYDTYNKKVIIARYQGEQYGFTCGLVSAWMTLPEPYKASPAEAEWSEE